MLFIEKVSNLVKEAILLSTDAEHYFYIKNATSKFDKPIKLSDKLGDLFNHFKDFIDNTDYDILNRSECVDELKLFSIALCKANKDFATVKAGTTALTTKLRELNTQLTSIVSKWGTTTRGTSISL